MLQRMYIGTPDSKMSISVREEHHSFLTVNAVDGFSWDRNALNCAFRENMIQG